MSTHSHDHDIDYKKAFTREDLEHSQVKLTGELPYSALAEERERAIKHLGKNVKIDGFRTGNIPTAMLEKHLGEMAIVTEMADRALAHHYRHVVEAHELDVVGQPQVEVTKLAPNNPLGVVLTINVVPQFDLPNYQDIAKGINKDKASAEVTDEEVQKQIEDIMRQKIAYERLQEKAAKNAEKHESDEISEATELPTPESEAAKQDEEEFDPEKVELPELTDEYVKDLGQPGQFETVDDFKAKIKEHLAIEKERDVNTAHRAKVTDAIIDVTEIAIPPVLLDAEIRQMFSQMEEELSRSGLKMEDYLNHIKKSREELGEEWKPAAEKRAKLQLILNKIAEKENITPDQKQLDTQVEQLMEQYKDANKHAVQMYVASVMINEAVMKHLEEL